MNNQQDLLVMAIQVAIIAILFYLIFYKKGSENLCVGRSYGVVTDIPASNYVNANMALIKSTSIGSAPLGDPKYWIGSHSPITQGMWGLYQPSVVPLDKTQPYDRSNLGKILSQVPVYSESDIDPFRQTAVNENEYDSF